MTITLMKKLGVIACFVATVGLVLAFLVLLKQPLTGPWDIFLVWVIMPFGIAITLSSGALLITYWRRW